LGERATDNESTRPEELTNDKHPSLLRTFTNSGYESFIILGLGRGSLVWTDGDAYVGEFKDGQFNGRGRFVGQNGSFYDGDFEDHLSNGFGIRRYSNGDWYEGSWSQCHMTFFLRNLQIFVIS
jgi:hypothetical protein